MKVIHRSLAAHHRPGQPAQESEAGIQSRAGDAYPGDEQKHAMFHNWENVALQFYMVLPVRGVLAENFLCRL